MIPFEYQQLAQLIHQERIQGPQHHPGAHEIDARARDRERRQFQLAAAEWSHRSHPESNRRHQLRQYLAGALHKLAARIEPSVGFARISASAEQPAATR